MKCRICYSNNLTKFLDLGSTPPADDFLVAGRLKEKEKYYPLDVYICNDCSLVQLGHTVPPEILFQNDYPYESSMTKAGQKHFHSFASDVVSRFKLNSKDLAVDIGSNVGVLLQGFKNEGLQVLGIDPADNICKIAIKSGIDTISSFFNEEAVREVIKKKGKAKVITGTNVFAHVDDIHSLVKNVDKLLSEKGIFIIEAPYLIWLLEHLEYDTIYHEHLSYLSVKPLNVLFGKHGMEIFDIVEADIHGGSIRYFIARQGDYKVTENVKRLITLEKEKKAYDIDRLLKFAKDVEKNREDLMQMLRELKNKGKRIVGVSAPAKGMTLLNYCKIGTDILDFVTEKSTLKIGKYTPGMHIPVLPDSELLKQKPDYALLLAWNFAEEIMNNLKDFKSAGGKFIIPIPKPRIVG